MCHIAKAPNFFYDNYVQFTPVFRITTTKNCSPSALNNVNTNIFKDYRFVAYNTVITLNLLSCHRGACCLHLQASVKKLSCSRTAKQSRAQQSSSLLQVCQPAALCLVSSTSESCEHIFTQCCWHLRFLKRRWTGCNFQVPLLSHLHACKKKFQHLGRISPCTETGLLNMKLTGNMPPTTVLPMEILEIRKLLFILFLAKMSYNIKAILKTSKLLVCGNTQYIIYQFCKKVLKIATTQPML